ncbi:MAG: enoyl-CoA hydratase/isomerase family protein [Ekhidna sp.]|nr:enoyl-CoA hydratase/isomerase family protein [Ekhidna sp.]MBC6425050.1 enoyl-CoA hydratase/isomerase family protein [Ekhidna sp.]
MEYVNLDINDGIGTVEFFTEQSNSLPGNILKKLASTINEAGETLEIRVIVLKSGGDRAFCAGANFDELITIDSPERGYEFFMGFANVINAMRKAPKFIIGRLQGKAIGGGIGLAAATDYCFATRFSSIKLSELALGIGPFIVSAPIERKIGLSAMSQVSINAEKFYDPKWCREKGLFNEVFESTEKMDKVTNEFVKKLAGYNPEAMREMKKAFWQGTDHWDELLSERAKTSGKLVLSDFTRIFIQKFRNK